MFFDSLNYLTYQMDSAIQYFPEQEVCIFILMGFAAGLGIGAGFYLCNRLAIAFGSWLGDKIRAFLVNHFSL